MMIRFVLQSSHPSSVNIVWASTYNTIYGVAAIYSCRFFSIYHYYFIHLHQFQIMVQIIT